MRSKEEIFNEIKKKGVKIKFLNDLIGGYRGKLTEWKKGKTTLTEKEQEMIETYLFGDSNLTHYNDNESVETIVNRINDDLLKLVSALQRNNLEGQALREENERLKMELQQLKSR